MSFAIHYSTNTQSENCVHASVRYIYILLCIQFMFNFVYVFSKIYVCISTTSGRHVPDWEYQIDKPCQKWRKTRNGTKVTQNKRLSPNYDLCMSARFWVSITTTPTDYGFVLVLLVELRIYMFRIHFEQNSIHLLLLFHYLLGWSSSVLPSVHQRNSLAFSFALFILSIYMCVSHQACAIYIRVSLLQLHPYALR